MPLLLLAAQSHFMDFFSASGTGGGANDSEDENPFDFRTTNDRFQQRLREAHKHTTDREIEQDLDGHVVGMPESIASLERERNSLLERVEAAESNVVKLEQEMERRQTRRRHEAEVSKLTPEERAQLVKSEQESSEIYEEIDLNFIYDYTIKLESAAMPKYANDMTSSAMLDPSNEMKAYVMRTSEVRRQEAFTHITFTETKNEVINKEGSLPVRRCSLKGETFGQTFSVDFDVTVDKRIINRMSLEVDIEMQIVLGGLLEQIKEECRVMDFFRLIVHYARLNHERQQIFDQLRSKFSKEGLTAVDLGENGLKFQNQNTTDPEVVFTWTADVQEDPVDRQKTGIDPCELVVPVVRMKAKTPPGWNGPDLHHIPEVFHDLMETQGILTAAELVIQTVLLVRAPVTRPLHETNADVHE